MRMRSHTVGAFIDAVYAIAVTILALEIPGTLEGDTFRFATFGAVLLEYCVTFFLLFTFWLQHRRINALTETVSRGRLWTTAAILMLVCLVPRATTLVFDLGGDVTLGAFEATIFHGAGWTTAEAVDLFYVVVVVLIDFGVLALLWMNKDRVTSDDLPPVHRSKVTTSILLVLVVGVSFLIPVENRYFLLVVPVVLFFENELSGIILRFRRSG